MASISKANSKLYARNELVSDAALDCYLITPTTALTADSESSNVITEGTIRKVVEAINPLMHSTASDGTKMVVIMDGQGTSATRIDEVLTDVLGESVTVALQSTLIGL